MLILACFCKTPHDSLMRHYSMCVSTIRTSAWRLPIPTKGQCFKSVFARPLWFVNLEASNGNSWLRLDFNSRKFWRSATTVPYPKSTNRMNPINHIPRHGSDKSRRKWDFKNTAMLAGRGITKDGGRIGKVNILGASPRSGNGDS